MEDFLTKVVDKTRDLIVTTEIKSPYDIIHEVLVSIDINT